VAPERILKWGMWVPVLSEAPEKTFFGLPTHFLGSIGTISRFGEHFCDGQHSLVSFLFVVLLLTVPPVPSHL